MARLLRASIILGVILPAVAAAGGPASPETPADSSLVGPHSQPLPETPFVKRPFHPFVGDRWIGTGIAYGPHRDGQSPGGADPTRAELREDLRIMAKHWSMLRVYGASGPASTLLDVIREDRIDMKVMLGIWIAVDEERDEDGRFVREIPEARTANRREVEAAVRLASEYPEIVNCVSVGNETQVDWSSHRIPPEALIGFVREVRARVRVPVTVADDFLYWSTPASRAVASEIDFLVTHIHPLWRGRQVSDALDFVRQTLAEVCATHPGHTIVLGETGWATKRHNEGEQATLMKGDTGEEQQKIFYDALSAWSERERIPCFFFEAFDENWKGGPHPDEVEKHWGLFRSDRTPKRAMTGDM